MISWKHAEKTRCYLTDDANNASNERFYGWFQRNELILPCFFLFSIAVLRSSLRTFSSAWNSIDLINYSWLVFTFTVSFLSPRWNSWRIRRALRVPSKSAKVQKPKACRIPLLPLIRFQLAISPHSCCKTLFEWEQRSVALTFSIFCMNSSVHFSDIFPTKTAAGVCCGAFDSDGGWNWEF